MNSKSHGFVPDFVCNFYYLHQCATIPYENEINRIGADETIDANDSIAITIMSIKRILRV